MIQSFTTQVSNLTGAWRRDDARLDAGSPHCGSVQTALDCVWNYKCVRSAHSGSIRATRLDNRGTRVRYCRNRLPTELFGTMPRSINR
jgi:hypothetical protein